MLQDTALQEDAFKRAGVQKVITEKWSSVGERPALRQLLRTLRAGDEVVVYKLDRLGRSLQDLLSILDAINAAGAKFRSLTEPIDTDTPAGKLMFSMLGAVAEFERSLIRQRSIAGQRAARERGKHCGRPRNTNMEVERCIVQLWRSGWYTMRTLAAIFDVHESTVKRVIYRVHRPESSSLR